MVTKKPKKTIKKEQFVPNKDVFEEEQVEQKEVFTPLGRQMLIARDYANDLVEILKENRTPILKIIGKDEYTTLVNAITLEVEAELIQRVVVYLEELKSGKRTNVGTGK